MKSVDYQIVYISPEFKAKYRDVGWFCDRMSASPELNCDILALFQESRNDNILRVVFRDDTSEEVVMRATKKLESFGLKLVPKTKQSN